MYKKLALMLLLIGSTSVFANPGPYVSVEAGAVNTTNSVFHFHPDGFAGRLAAGFLTGATKLTYGAEFGALLYPHVSEGTSGLFATGNSVTSSYNFELLGVVKYTFDSHFLLLAKLGPAYVHQTHNGTTLAGVYKHRSLNSGALDAVIGGGYQITPQTSATLTTSAMAGIYTSPTLLVGITHSF